MTKRAYLTIAGLILVALVALLIYSLDRTSWLLAQYELSQPDTLAAWLGLAPLALGVAAALVIEVGAVALVAGDVLASAHPHLKRYAVAGLVVVLAIQALANLLAGFVRGYQAVLATLIMHDADPNVAWLVAGFAWALSSVAVPALIFILSQLAALTMRLALQVSVSTAQTALQALPKRLEAVIAVDRVSQAVRVDTSAPVAPSLATENPPLTLVESGAKYPCPHCGVSLKSKQSLGAAVANGYCPTCKAERRAA